MVYHVASVKASQLEALIIQTSDVSPQDYSFVYMDYYSFLLPRQIQEKNDPQTRNDVLRTTTLV